MQDWYAPLRALRSKGSMADRPGSLGGLAQARQIHQGQFFTPDAIAALMWRIAAPALQGITRSVSVFDNSVGSGRLLQYADPANTRLFGVDVDSEAVTALGIAAQDAGFNEVEFEACGMEEIQPRNMDVALINPPFSVHLDAPSVVPYPCTCYGKFGPGTSTISHAYALAQAVNAANIVVALLPSTFASEVAANPEATLWPDDAARLAAHIALPAGLFREENTDVSVSLLVFSSLACDSVVQLTLKSLDDPIPDLKLALGRYFGTPTLARVGVENEVPSITLPVTGDTTVRVNHDSRRIHLSYFCGLTQAKVANAVLREQVPQSDGVTRHRYPKGVHFTGQGLLDLEIHLMQDNPEASFNRLVTIIEDAGGKAVVDQGLAQYLKRRIRQHARQATPIRHSVFVQPGTACAVAKSLIAIALRDHVANPKVWGSPVIQAGMEVSFTLAADGRYDYEFKGKSFRLNADELRDRFEVMSGSEATGWKVAHEGMHSAFPDQAHALRARAIKLGIDKWLTWEFQFNDLIELALKSVGGIAAWEMGLGKARLACALALLSGCKHALITVEAGLLDEMAIELRGLPIPADSWQIIRTPDHLASLRQINVISYERLRLPLISTVNVEEGEEGEETSASIKKKLRIHKTYAGRLRRRCGIVISDEGDLLANPDSQQSRCLWNLSAKRRFILSGTPIANYPRDILHLLSYACGNGTAAQPYGYRGAYLEKRLATSMAFCSRGIDAFRDRFVITEWVTNEFSDSLTEGAKREIPKIADLNGYRAMLAPHVKRRITAEPDVAACIKMPKANYKLTTVKWDDAHLNHFLAIADEFASWYCSMRDKNGLKGSNLVAILARIQAVAIAQDFPQMEVKGFGSYGPLTSKQRYVIDRAEQLVREGRKVILYAENPGNLEIIHRQLAKRNVEAVLFHGKIPITQRTKTLNNRFRFGDAPVLAASLGCTQKGLNLWQADYVLALSRSWSAIVEEQAFARPLRPQQTRQVTIEQVHLEGSLDVYKDQLVRFKSSAAKSGLDWGEQEDDVEFLHLDTVIYRFVEALSKRKGISTHELRQALAA